MNSTELLIRNLQRRIALFEPDEKAPPDAAFINTNIIWNPGEFIKKVLMSSEMNVIRTEDMPKIDQDFQAQHGFNVSLDNLYRKFWLRNVMGLCRNPDNNKVRYKSI